MSTPPKRTDSNANNPKAGRRSFLAKTSAMLSAAALAPESEAQGPSQSNPPKKYRLIATEEACAFPDQFDAYRKITANPGNDDDLVMWNFFFKNTTLIRRLLDFGEERLRLMNESGIDMHLLSMTAPGVQFFDADTATAMASSTNDQLAAIVAKNPTRYGALASFAPQDPKRAAKEIDRAMNQLKFNGLIVNSHTHGEYLDDPKFWPIFEAAVASKAAIYIHPRNLPVDIQRLTRATKMNLYGPPWAFHTETGTHAVRLITSGVFDQFPDLKIVLGHMGESLPFWLYRMDKYIHLAKHKPSEYFKNNFLITTSGMNDHPVLRYCHEVLSADNIMFAIDYPYVDSVEASRFMQSATLPPADMEKITHGNAERIFHVKTA
jgi:5-carboxyvanillate decarboxylase